MVAMQVMAATTLVTEFNLQKLVVKLVRVSSTLPKTRRAAMRYNDNKASGFARNEKAVRETNALLLDLPNH